MTEESKRQAGARGGARPGAGRKLPKLPPVETPVELLEVLFKSDAVSPAVRLAAAKLLIEVRQREEIEKFNSRRGL